MGVMKSNFMGSSSGSVGENLNFTPIISTEEMINIKPVAFSGRNVTFYNTTTSYLMVPNDSMQNRQIQCLSDFPGNSNSNSDSNQNINLNQVYTINVLSKPVVKTIISQKSVIENQNISVSCQILSGNPLEILEYRLINNFNQVIQKNTNNGDQPDPNFIIKAKK